MSAPSPAAADADGIVRGPAAAFGLAAVLAILFNTASVWVKAVDPQLDAYVTSLTGDPWSSRAIADIVVFVALGYYFMSRKHRIDGVRLSVLLAGATVVAGGGLALRFVLV